MRSWPCGILGFSLLEPSFIRALAIALPAAFAKHIALVLSRLLHPVTFEITVRRRLTLRCGLQLVRPPVETAGVTAGVSVPPAVHHHRRLLVLLDQGQLTVLCPPAGLLLGRPPRPPRVRLRPVLCVLRHGRGGRAGWALPRSYIFRISLRLLMNFAFATVKEVSPSALPAGHGNRSRVRDRRCRPPHLGPVRLDALYEVGDPRNQPDVGRPAG